MNLDNFYENPVGTFDKVKEFFSKIQKKVDSEIPDGITIIGDVVIEKNVNFIAPVVIEGPVFIGEGSQIGPFSHIRPFTYLEKNCTVSSFAQIKASIIRENTNVPHLNYVGDSIIGKNCNLGAGTIIANLRFDDKNVKITSGSERVDSVRRKFGVVMGNNVKTGVNVSIMPGVKISDNKWIDAGTVVKRDV